MEYVKKTTYSYAGVCKYNLSVDCTEKNKCDKCGWNPEVDEARKKKTKVRLKYESKGRS